MKEYSYTSIPPIGCTACTEPQCLYKGVLYLYLTFKGKGKVIPLQASTGPECSRRLRLPDVQIIGT
jgi:hypothetical protein